MRLRDRAVTSMVRIPLTNPSVYTVGAAGFWLKQIELARQGERPDAKMDAFIRRAFWKERNRIQKLSNIVTPQN